MFWIFVGRFLEGGREGGMDGGREGRMSCPPFHVVVKETGHVDLHGDGLVLKMF